MLCDTAASSCREDAWVQNVDEMLAWIPATQSRAEGHWEAAQAGYSELLEAVSREDGPRMWDESLPLTWAQATEAYAAVSDWQGLESFLAKLGVRCLSTQRLPR